MEKIIAEIKKNLCKEDVSVNDLEKCWDILTTEPPKSKYSKSANAFIETYFGEGNTENWETPGAIDLLDFSNLDSKKLEPKKITMTVTVIQICMEMLLREKRVQFFISMDFI